jgi:hypothetical protein
MKIKAIYPPVVPLTLFTTALLLAAPLLFATAATAIEGKYTIAGTNPNESSYMGTLMVAKTGSTYQLTWKVGKTSYMGTGLLVGNVLSVGYTIPGLKGCGVVAYTVGNKRLDGIWTNCGGKANGKEVATR